MLPIKIMTRLKKRGMIQNPIHLVSDAIRIPLNSITFLRHFKVFFLKRKRWKMKDGSEIEGESSSDFPMKLQIKIACKT
jgi:hypothetical protein